MLLKASVCRLSTSRLSSLTFCWLFSCSEASHYPEPWRELSSTSRQICLSWENPKCGLMQLPKFSSHTVWVWERWSLLEATTNSRTMFTSKVLIGSLLIKTSHMALCVLQRCTDCVHSKLVNINVCRFCNLLCCWLHGTWTTKTCFWSSCIR